MKLIRIRKDCHLLWDMIPCVCVCADMQVRFRKEVLISYVRYSCTVAPTLPLVSRKLN